MSYWYAGATIVSAIGGSLISSSAASKSAAAANKANQDANAANNAQNLSLFNLSRGGVNPETGYGNAILPTYFGGQEQDLGQAAYNHFLRMSGQGADSYNSLTGYQQGMTGSLNNSLDALNSRYDGRDLAQRQAYSNPYYQARRDQAQTYGQGYSNIAAANVSGINTGLSQAINQMNAQRSAQGFYGNSTFDRNRAMAATMDARQRAGVITAQAGAQGNNLMADANLANAGDNRAMQFADLDFRANPAALGAGLGIAGDFYNAPGQASANSFNTAMQPLNYFRISPQAFQNTPPPQVTPGISNGQIIGAALSQGGQAYGNYLASNRLLSQYGGGNYAGMNQYGPGGGGYQAPPASSNSNFSLSGSNPYANWGASSTGGFTMPPPGG